MDKIISKIANLGFIIILIGMVLWTEKLYKDIEYLQELVHSQANYIIQCNEKENSYYDN